jgi:predicted NAD/FAD-binding protein
VSGRLQVGVIGAGISGMMAAWLLQEDHDVTLLERAPRLGGHVETVAVGEGDRRVYGELGTRFFFDSAYPYFLGLLRLLGLPLRWTDGFVSITRASDRSTVVLPPRSLRHVGALVRSPRALRHALSLRRLIHEQRPVADGRDFSVSLRRHLALRGYPASFDTDFIVPFLAACWGAPLEAIPHFPVYSLLKGMPDGRRAGFYEIPGGLSRYVEALEAELTKVDVRPGTAVARIAEDDGFRVEDERGGAHRFDRLIVATSAKDGAELLRGLPAAAEMQALLSAFRHFDTEIALHGDRAFMPPDERDWAHNNLFFDHGSAWMTDWQGLHANAPVFRTWVPKGRALPKPLYAHRRYHHLIMTPDNAVLQRAIAARQGARGLWVTGMYAVDIDNHESALLSGVAPARVLAPASRNLARLSRAVAADAPHGLELIPVAGVRPPLPAVG